jgi:hypothetical protein
MPGKITLLILAASLFLVSLVAYFWIHRAH